MPISNEEPDAVTGAPALVSASAVQCETGTVWSYLARIKATDPIYGGSNGKFQFIEYWSILQKWDGVSAWKDQLWSLSRGSTDTLGSTLIAAIYDRYPVSLPGYYRIQYYVRWWNGYVKGDGTKVGVTSVIKSGRFNVPASVYRQLLPDVIVIGGDPGQAGVPTGTPWCFFRNA